jgi:hypothetical protein
MFIGDNNDAKSISSGYIRAFVNTEDYTSKFHFDLYQAGIYKEELPYITNYHKGFRTDYDRLKAIEDEIKIVKPRKIISLGENKNLDKIINSYETIEHPRDIKTKTDNLKYIETLRNICTTQK